MAGIRGGDQHEAFVTDLEHVLQDRAAEWQTCLNNDTPDELANFINAVLQECGKKYFEKGAPKANAQQRRDTEERIRLLRHRRDLRLLLPDAPDEDHTARVTAQLKA
eukprot:3631872-Pyramimonas_sp.AAC.1